MQTSGVEACARIGEDCAGDSSAAARPPLRETANPPLGFPSEKELFSSCGVQQKKPAMLGDRGWTDCLGIIAWKFGSRPDST